MKNLSRRIAAVTPSITVALILFTVGLTGLLAYRAFEASRAQRRVTEQTLRDYAGFAAFQLKNAMIARISGQHQRVFDLVFRQIATRGPIPPLGAEQVAALVDSRRALCHCVDSVSFYYQVTFADSAIETSASALATAATLRMLRDTVMAQAATRRDPPPPSAGLGTRQLAPINAQFFVPIFAMLGGRPYVFAHALTVDPNNAPVVAYGYAAPAELIVGSAVRGVLAGGQPVLPRTLIRGVAVDSILSVGVTTVNGEPVFASSSAIDRRYASVDSLDPRLGALRVEVSIKPAAAGRLVIGGLPHSRLPEVLATAFVAVSLLALLMFQFRRQEELGRLREDFVSGVSHELRTPLAQIRLLAELLHMGKVPTAEDKDRSLRIIDQEARRLTFLVESILSFTRPEAGHQLHPVSTDVAKEIEEIIGAFEPLAQTRSVQVTTNLERGLMADVDPGALRQVLINLLDNAVRYGPAGQKVSVTTASDRDTWTIEVTDEGPGVPAEERERIFAPYYRMTQHAGGPVGGTGIGLAVVQRLVKQHGGQVHVTSMRGGSRGARFVVELPIAARSNGAG